MKKILILGAGVYQVPLIKKARELGLSIVTGTQRRHGRDYNALYQQVQAGAIGDIVSGNVWWNGGKLWHKDHNPLIKRIVLLFPVRPRQRMKSDMYDQL